MREGAVSSGGGSCGCTYSGLGTSQRKKKKKKDAAALKHTTVALHHNSKIEDEKT